MKLYILSDYEEYVDCYDYRDYQIYGVYDSEEKAKEVMKNEWNSDNVLNNKYNDFEEWFNDNYKITIRELNKIYFYGEEV